MSFFINCMFNILDYILKYIKTTGQKRKNKTFPDKTDMLGVVFLVQALTVSGICKNKPAFSPEFSMAA